MKILLIILAGVALTIGQNSLVWAQEEKEEEHQECLFNLEEAYTKDKGGWETCFTVQYMDNKKSREVEYEDGDREDTLKIKDEWNWRLGIDYGIFDWLTAELEIPFANVDKKTIKDEEDSTTITYLNKAGIGDIDAGLKFGLFKDQEKSWVPAVSLGLDVSLPTGNWKKDLGSNHYGFGSLIAVSKTFDKWAYHLNAGGTYTPHGREEGETEKVDAVAFEGGIALAYMPTENLDLVCEVSTELERENTAGEYNYNSEVYLTPGIVYKFKNFLKGLKVTAGVPVGLTYESYDWGIITQVIKEF